MRNIDGSELPAVKLINATGSFPSKQKMFKSFGGLYKFILENHRSIFNVDLDLPKVEVYRTIFEPMYTQRRAVIGRWRNKNALFNWFAGHFKANVSSAGSGWGTGEYEIKWVKVVFSIDENARKNAKYTDSSSGFKDAIPDIVPFPKSYYRTAKWIEGINFMVLDKMGDVDVNSELADGFQIRKRLGEVLTLTMRNGIVLALLSKYDEHTGSGGVHDLLNVHPKFAAESAMWFSSEGVANIALKYEGNLWSVSALNPSIPSAPTAPPVPAFEDDEEKTLNTFPVFSGDIIFLKFRAIKWFDFIFGEKREMPPLNVANYLRMHQMSEDDVMNIAAQCQGHRNQFEELRKRYQGSHVDFTQNSNGDFILVGKRKYPSMGRMDTSRAVNNISFLCGVQPKTYRGPYLNQNFQSPNPWQVYVLDNAGKPSDVFTACTSGTLDVSESFLPLCGSFKFFNYQMVTNTMIPPTESPFLLFLWGVYLSILNFMLNTRNPRTKLSDEKTRDLAVTLYGNLLNFGIFLWFLMIKAKELKLDKGFIDNLQKVINADSNVQISDDHKVCIASALNLQIVEFMLMEDFAVSDESNRLLVKARKLHCTQHTYLYDSNSVGRFLVVPEPPDLANVALDYSKAMFYDIGSLKLPYLSDKVIPVSKRMSFYEAVALSIVGDNIDEKKERVRNMFKDSIYDMMLLGYVHDRDKTFSSGQNYTRWDENWIDDEIDDEGNVTGTINTGKTFIPVQMFKVQTLVRDLIDWHYKYLARYDLSNISSSGNSFWNFRTINDLTLDEKFKALCELYDKFDYYPNPVELEIFCEYANMSIVIFENSNEHVVFIPTMWKKSVRVNGWAKEDPPEWMPCRRALSIHGKRYYNYYKDNITGNPPSREIVLIEDTKQESAMKFRNVFYHFGNVKPFDFQLAAIQSQNNVYMRINIPEIPRAPNSRGMGYECLYDARLKPYQLKSSGSERKFSMDWENLTFSRELLAESIDDWIGRRDFQVTFDEIKKARELVKSGQANHQDKMIASYSTFAGFLRTLDNIGDSPNRQYSEIKYDVLLEAINNHKMTLYKYIHDKKSFDALWDRFLGKSTFRRLPVAEQKMSRWIKDDIDVRGGVGPVFLKLLAKHFKKRVVVLKWNEGVETNRKICAKSTTADVFDIQEIRDFNYDEFATDIHGDSSFDSKKQLASEVLTLFYFVVYQCIGDQDGHGPYAWYYFRVCHPMTLPRNAQFPFTKIGVADVITNLPDIIGDTDGLESNFSPGDAVNSYRLFTNAEMSHHSSQGRLSSMLSAHLSSTKREKVRYSGELINPIQIHIINNEKAIENAEFIDKYFIAQDLTNRTMGVVDSKSSQEFRDQQRKTVLENIEKVATKLQCPNIFRYAYCALLCHGNQLTHKLNVRTFSKLYQTPRRILVDAEDVERENSEQKEDKKRKKKKTKQEIEKEKEELKIKTELEIKMKKARVKAKIIEEGLDPNTILDLNFMMNTDEYFELMVWKKIYSRIPKTDPPMDNLRGFQKLFPKIESLMLTEDQEKSWGPWLTFIRAVQVSLQIHSIQTMKSTKHPGSVFSYLKNSLTGNQIKLIETFRDDREGSFAARGVPSEVNDSFDYFKDDLVIADKRKISFCGILHPSNFKLSVAAQMIDFLLKRADFTLKTSKKNELTPHDRAFVALITRVKRRWFEHALVSGDRLSEEMKELPFLVFSDTLYDEYYKTLTPTEQYSLIMEDARAMSALYFLKIKFVRPYGCYDCNSYYISSTRDDSGFYYYSERTETGWRKARDLNDVWFFKHGLQWVQTPVLVPAGAPRDKVPHDYFFEAWKYDKAHRNPFLKDKKKLDPIEVHAIVNFSKDKMILNLNRNNNSKHLFFNPCNQGNDHDVGVSANPTVAAVNTNPTDKAGGGIDGDCPNRQKGGGGDRSHITKGKNRQSEADLDRQEKEREMYGNYEWGSTNNTSAQFLGFSKPDLHQSNPFINVLNDSTKGIVLSHGWQEKGLDILRESPIGDCINEDGKEIYMLSSRMGSTMATLQHLNDGAFLAVKIHKAIQPQAQAFACLLSSCFQRFTAIPFTEVYTDNIQFVGHGFSSQRLQKYALLDKLRDCMCLREDVFQVMCEKLACEYDDYDRHQLECFRKHLAWCCDKVYAERFKHDILMCQVYIEGTLDGRIKARLPWISKQSAKLLNSKVFHRVSAEVRNQNMQIIRSILKSPAGALLKPLFSPTCNPEIPLPCVTIQDQMQCLVTSSGRLSSQMGSNVSGFLDNEKNLIFIISLAESLDRRLHALEDLIC